MPEISGLDEFQGRVIHSKFFKNPEEFRGQHVVLVGFGASSADLTLHISKAASKVTICHKFPYGFKLGLLPHNACEKKNVKNVTMNGVVTDDGEIISCDAIILCTGISDFFYFFESMSKKIDKSFIKDNLRKH